MMNKTELWSRLKKIKKPIVLYGMGNGADRILDQLELMQIKAAGVFASDDFVRHQSFRGYTVCSYDELKAEFGEMVVLLAFGTHRPDVIENVKRIMAEQELYVPDVPVAGKALFNGEFIISHRAELEQAYRLLADDASRFAFESVVLAKLTGDPGYLFRCETTPQEAYKLLDLGSREIYLDIGAYTGDTIQRFLSMTDGAYERILAAEPDRKNYAKLLKNTAHLENVEYYHNCIDECDGERIFEMDGGRKSHSLSGAGEGVTAVTVDELLGGKPVTFIKMDVEGMEASVLRGAAETIRRFGPRMDIAAYHRSEDLFALPLLIETIRPGAKIYFRHFPCLPAWDCNFYTHF